MFQKFDYLQYASTKLELDRFYLALLWDEGLLAYSGVASVDTGYRYAPFTVCPHYV